MPLPTVNELTALTHRALTPMADERQSPNSAIKNMLFSKEETHDTRQVQLSAMKRDRKTVPFVRRDRAALVVTHGKDERFALEPAHIRIKEFVTAADLATRRSVDQPADGVTRQMMEATAAKVLGTRQEEMMWDIFDTEEWMCAQILTGSFSYTSEEEAFDVDLQRDAAHDMTAAIFWDQATADPQIELLAGMELTNEAEGTNPNVAICGALAGKAFLKWAKLNVGAILKSDSRVATGTVEGLIGQIDARGMIYLGTTFHNVAVFMYLRKLLASPCTTAELRTRTCSQVSPLLPSVSPRPSKSRTPTVTGSWLRPTPCPSSAALIARCRFKCSPNKALRYWGGTTEFRPTSSTSQPPYHDVKQTIHPRQVHAPPQWRAASPRPTHPCKH